MPDLAQLANEQAAAMGVSSLPIRGGWDANAATDGHELFVNETFMREVDSAAGEGGVRFVLAHEIGHAACGMTGGHTGEFEADQFAARSVAALGFGVEAVLGVMGILDPSPSETHPAASARAIVARSAWAGYKPRRNAAAQARSTATRMDEPRKKRKAAEATDRGQLAIDMST